MPTLIQDFQLPLIFYCLRLKNYVFLYKWLPCILSLRVLTPQRENFFRNSHTIDTTHKFCKQPHNTYIFSYFLNSLLTMSVSLLAFLARRFCNTRISKNEISSHLWLYIKTHSMAERVVYMLPQEKQLSDFSPLYFEFADSLAGQSFIALLNVTSSIMDRRCKDKTFFWKLQHCELIFFILPYIYFIKWYKGKKKKRTSVSPFQSKFSPF